MSRKNPQYYDEMLGLTRSMSRYYVEYYDLWADSEQRYIYVYASGSYTEAKEQIRKMLDDYEIIVIDCTD